jgi:hypothetical protein
MIDQISSDIETIVDTNNNSNNKSFKSLNNNYRKQTNSLIRLFGNKLKCSRRRATSLNDINVKFQSKFSSANSIKLIDETTTTTNNPSKLQVAGCLNCQNRSTNSEISLLGTSSSSKASDLNYSKDCCHSCSLYTERSFKIHKEKNRLIKNTNLKMFENYSDQTVPVENNTNKSSYTNDNFNYKNNKTFSNTSSSSSYNEFENFNSLTFYKQCYVRVNNRCDKIILNSFIFS